jgi:small-conductance mechanosensitive channel
MTSSDDDDLEHELGENLKLRRKLGTEAAKAEGAIDAKQGGGIAYRLGWVLYWICLALAVVWVWGLFWDLLSSFS